MHKTIKSIFSIALCLCLFLSASLFSRAEESGQAETITHTILHLTTVEDFLAFSENCRLDNFSQNLVVVLDEDIDLTGINFEGISTFSGIFEGGHHSISGLSVKGEGSVQGLFRYLQSTAVVRNLTVEGDISPTGSRNTAGGLAGSNAGRIENCNFTGSVTGADNVGGIAGINQLTGIIERSYVEGVITGNHFIGGIAGENIGVIRNCTNSAQINTTAIQNSVEISDITLDTLTNSESANTVTDVGGIAGYSSGVIRSCQNQGDVGYQHMGYNIGGIAGTQTGYITQCQNFGQVYGRKEVGGIVGQMEPIANIEYSMDTLQILQEQLGTMSSLTNQASANAQYSAAKVSGNIATLQGQVQAARDAVDTLIPDEENPEFPDEDRALAALNSLNGNLSAMPGTLSNIASSTQNAAYIMSRDMTAITNQVNAMGQTIGNASENLGGSITDISDNDTSGDLTSKVEDCINYGAVLADLNVGGITGAIAFENDLDPEEDVEIIGDSSLNFESEVRAVILNCENTATITVKKQNGGGIAGWMSLGLAKNCRNTGAIAGDTADYVGGISGNSSGFIRQSSVKCILEGASYVGGIAGNGSTVTDCRSMVLLSGTEKKGAILGNTDEIPDAAEETPKVYSNYYLIVGTDTGAVDGISYAQCAEPLNQTNFFALENLPRFFQTVTLRFLYEDGTEQVLALTPGSSLNTANIPKIPEKDGYLGTWEGLDEIDLTSVSFDATIHAIYTQREATLQSEENRDNGLPVLLAQGLFSADQFILLTELTNPPATAEGETLLEGLNFAISDGNATQLRYLPGTEYIADNLRVVVRDSFGNWREVSFTQDGSYLVFAVSDNDDAFCLIQKPPENHFTQLLIGTITVIIILILILLHRHKKRKKKKEK